MASESAIDVAKGLQVQGKTAEAEILYRELLANEPDSLGALEGLGVVCFQKGRIDEAAASSRGGRHRSGVRPFSRQPGRSVTNHGAGSTRPFCTCGRRRRSIPPRLRHGIALDFWHRIYDELAPPSTLFARRSVCDRGLFMLISIWPTLYWSWANRRKQPMRSALRSRSSRTTRSRSQTWDAY